MTYKDILLKHEGLRLKPYEDTKGILTIGVGRNLRDNGISEEEAEFMLENDIVSTLQDLRKVFDDFDTFPYNVKLVLVDMMFNLGMDRFLGFKKMIQAVKNRDWMGMIREMKDSKWCRELTSRCADDVNLIDEMISSAS